MTLAILILCAAAYRYSGAGYPAGSVVWGLAVALAAYALGGGTYSVLAGLGAYAGRQFISHSVVYRLNSKCAGPWFSVCFTRGALIAAPLGFALLPVALTAAACLAANYLSRKLEDRWTIHDMLKLAEPLQGLWYGVLIVMCLGGAG